MVAELRQASLAVNVLVKERLQPPVVTIAPSLEVIVTAPQASVAVAVPSEEEGEAGLHPNATFAELLVKVGGVMSTIHVTVLDVVDELLQASIAVNVLI